MDKAGDNIIAATNITEMAMQETKEFIRIMSTVCVICNVCSFILSSHVIYNLIYAMVTAKKNKDKAKRKLYLYSSLFVS